MIITPSSPFLFSSASQEPVPLPSPAPPFPTPKTPHLPALSCQADRQGLTAPAAPALGTTSGFWSGLWNNLGFPQSFNRTSATKKWFRFRVNNMSPSTLQTNTPPPSQFFFFKLFFKVNEFQVSQ